MDLIIFMADGTTMRFQNLENFKNVDGVLTFDYFGESTQVKRRARFVKYAGYGLSIES